MADNFGPGGVYANIPRLDSHGRTQLPMFMRWNPNPVGNDAKNLSGLSPDLQKVVARARADNPNLNFVIGNGKRSAADQDQAKTWGWSRVGSQDGGDANVHMQGNAVDLWGLDSNGRVQFNPSQQKQISQAMKTAAQEEGVGVNWGGDWKSFKDAPHFELAGGGSAAASGAPEGPTATSGAPAPTTSTSSSAPSGTTLNSGPAQGSTFETMRNNIAQFESGNNYSILGPVLRNGDQAIGKYQVMGSNVPSWTQRWLGHSMTPAEFRASPEAQEAVFKGEFGSYLQQGSPADAASRWFTGKPLAQGANLKDVLGTSGGKYAEIATKGIDNPNAIGTTINAAGAPPVAAGAPTAVAGGPPAAPAAPVAGTTLPGFQPGSPANKMAQAGLKQLAGGGGADDKPPPPMQLPQAPPAQTMGGPMMMGPGGQNFEGRAIAAQNLAQQGFSMQPQLASVYGALGAARPLLPSTAASTIAPMAPSQATGIPGLPGTTLNSPSQLQMALMSGQMSPYDLYATAGMSGGGFGYGST